MTYERDKSDERADRSGGIGGVVGAALGPFAATVGSAVGEDRIGPKATIGNRRGDGEAVLVEIEGVGSGDSGGPEAGKGPDEAVDGTGD